MSIETGHKSKASLILKSIQGIFLCLALFLFLPSSGQTQEEVSTESPASVITSEGSISESIWSGDLVGPPSGLPVEENPPLAIFPPELTVPPKVAIFSDSEQQIPVMKVMGEYFDPSGFCATAPLSELSTQAIRSQLLRAYNMGFGCFMLRVDWPSLEPEANRFDGSRVQEILRYAHDIGLKIIISLEFDKAPAWFFQGASGGGRVTVSYLVDPEMEHATGNDGDLRWTNGTGVPLMYHPDTLRDVDNLVHSLFNTIKSEPALVGWFLCGPVTLSYPGGGLGGVVGMADYSPFSVNRFFEMTGTPLVSYPLPRYSRGTRDQRPEFRMFLDFRLSLKQETFNQIVRTLREFDREHMILIGMDPALNYRNDNGYLSMIQAPSATRMMLDSNVSGVVINFRLASDTFEPLCDRSESSAMHLALTINQVVRNGRLAIVLIEADASNPPSPFDILDIADMVKAAGAYPIWSSGFIQKRSKKWSWQDLNAIERAQPLSILPPPSRLRRGQVAILDISTLYSTYYCERNGTIVLALNQLCIHQKTGVLLEIVGVSELLGSPPVLQQYTNVITLVPELVNDADALNMINPGLQLVLAGYKLGGGMIESVDPMLLHQYALEGYHSDVLEDQLRTRYVHRGASADQLNGADAFIVANDPYVFVRVNQLHGAKGIDVVLNGWDEEMMPMADFVELPSTDPYEAQVISGSANLKFGMIQNLGHLYMLADNYEQVSKPYEARKIGVAITQQSRQMRRSVPAALLLLALLAVTMVWMGFQSQQKSLIQAAELVDRSRRIEPIDILDEPDVREFYRRYISEKENGSDNTAKRDKLPISDTRKRK